jgi:hypothetical protein
MDMIVQVKIKSVYGNERIYPVNKQAKMFASLTNKATLDRRDVGLIKDLGFTVEVAREVL